MMWFRSGSYRALPFVVLLCAAFGAAVKTGNARANRPSPAQEQQKDKAAPPPDLGPMHTIEFDTDEGTWMDVDVSPDGKTIVFNLLGDIYTLPISGGEAKLLYGGRTWDTHPVYSPDGRSIAFISDRDGNRNLWIMDTDGTHARQITHEQKNKIAGIAWAPSGDYLLIRKLMWNTYLQEISLIYPNGGSGVKILGSNGYSDPPSGAAFSPDGRYVYYAIGGRPATLNRLDRITGESLELAPEGFRPVASPDGRWLVYGSQHDTKSVLRVRDLRTGEERELAKNIPAEEPTAYEDTIPHYAFLPDSSAVIVTIAGKLHRIAVTNGADQPIPFHAHVSQQVAAPVHVPWKIDDGDLNVKILRWPTLSPDGTKLAFSAIGKLWMMDFPSGTPRRLTSSSEREYAPSFSPDGRSLAYVTWSDIEKGRVRVISVDGGDARTLTTVPGRYTNPAWSRDGSKIAFASGTGAELRGEQPENDPNLELRWISAQGGESHRITAYDQAPGMAGWRYHPAPIFSANGERIFYFQPKEGTNPGVRFQREVLLSVRLDGSDRREHLSFPTADEVVPSPDGRNVAVVAHEDVYVMPLPLIDGPAVAVDFESAAVPVRRMSQENGNYVGWRDSNTLFWTFANRVYQQRLDAAADSASQSVEVRLTVPRPRPERKVAYTNARIVTMNGDEVIERGTIVVNRNRIESIGPSTGVHLPTDAKIIDVSGKTIIPGMIDVHDHMSTMAEVEIIPQQRWKSVANLAYGVTTGYDPSSPSLETFTEGEMVESGEMLGPRIFTSGAILYGAESGSNNYADIRNIDDARRAVRRYKRDGVNMLKEYMQPRRDQRQWLVQAAREEGVEITAEGEGDTLVDLTMMADGYTCVEHNLPNAPLYHDVIQFMARSGVQNTPTLIVSLTDGAAEDYFYSHGNLHDDAKLRRFTPEQELDPHRQWDFRPDDEWGFLTVSRSLAEVTHAGGLVSVGAHGNRHGLGTHWEMWALAMGGITPLEALREATLRPAQKTGLDGDLGSLAAGKLADFIVLNSNPLQDIRRSTDIRYVVKNGVIYDGESMTELWPERKPLPRFFWMNDADAHKFAAPEPPPFGK
jgi:Tol biopolymer transport system component/imidazolonepropionase-like amidohydrolase